MKVVLSYVGLVVLLLVDVVGVLVDDDVVGEVWTSATRSSGGEELRDVAAVV